MTYNIKKDQQLLESLVKKYGTADVITYINEYKIPNIENTKENRAKRLLKYKDDMIDMIYSGSSISDIYKKYNINNQYQPIFNKIFAENNNGLSLRDVKEQYIKSLSPIHTAHKKQNEYDYVIMRLYNILSEIKSGGNIKDVLRKYKI